MEHRYAQLGSVSHGTMRPQDLIPRFLDVLRGLNAPEYVQLTTSPFGAIPAHAQEDENDEWWQSEEANYLLEDLFDILDHYAPPYCYFGAQEGDGSDYGFWVDWHALEDAEEDAEILRVDSLDEIPKQEVLVVNDHGSIAYGYVDAEGFHEIWSVI